VWHNSTMDDALYLIFTYVWIPQFFWIFCNLSRFYSQMPLVTVEPHHVSMNYFEVSSIIFFLKFLLHFFFSVWYFQLFLVRFFNRFALSFLKTPNLDQQLIILKRLFLRLYSSEMVYISLGFIAIKIFG
jgi:hypothetical protein